MCYLILFMYCLKENGFFVYCGNLNKVWFNDSSFKKRKKNFCVNCLDNCYWLREILLYSYM